MCTAITWDNGDFYFGRNMDICYNFAERVIITPSNYPITFKCHETITTHYPIIGMGSVIDNYPLYAEAMNNQGLGVAGLNFPRYAHYHSEISDDKANITPYEFILWILAKCKTVDEAIPLIQSMQFYALAFKEGLPLATLHFMLADKNKSVVVEPLKEGIKIYDNPVGAMTNNPTFDFHLTNLSNYLNISPVEATNTFCTQFPLQPLGHGSGGLGLPGDTTTVSRFIRIVFHKLNSNCEKSESCNVGHFMHLLSTVEVPKGCARDENGLSDYTTYSSCMNMSQSIYYYKTYTNHQLTAVKLNDESGNELLQFPLRKEENIYYETSYKEGFNDL